MWKFWTPILATMTAMENELALLRAACDYFFDVLCTQLQDIRLSEKPALGKICLLFATSIDYRRDADAAGKFFAAAHKKFQCGMNTQVTEPSWSESQEQLNRILSRLFDFADLQAQQHRPMDMQAWSDQLTGLLALNDCDLQHHNGRRCGENHAHCMQEHGKQPAIETPQQKPAANAEYGRAPKRQQQKASMP
jgi:hypothetical protein